MKLYYGRLGRLGYLLGVLYLILIWTGISLVEVAILGAVSGGSFTSSAAGGQVANGLSVFMFILIGVSMVVLFIFSYGLQARRWHDLNCSGWFSLVGLVPVLGIVTLLLLFIPGTNGSNRFGEPYQGGHGLRPVLGL